MNIVTRAEWGARPPSKTPVKINTPTPELWLHHTASPDGGAARVRAIQNFHMDVRGWSDIAYSFLVNGDGLIFEGRGAGIAGGHTAGHNTVSHAICVLGNYNVATPSAAAIDSVVELARHGFAEGWWPQLFTGGHRDASGADTSCPGDRLHSRIPEINQLLEDDMPTAAEIAAAVWQYTIPDAPTGEPKHTNFVLRAIRNDVRALLLDPTQIDTADLAAIAKAVNDELARRTQG